MRQGFTLIELMIVIAIIAVIAAIAIPNLLESRVSSQEASAAASLKSGIVPGQVTFQSGSYSDLDNDGLGTFCVVGSHASGVVPGTTAAGVQAPYNVLAGQIATGGGIILTILAPTFRIPDTAATALTVSANPSIAGYNFSQPISATAPVPQTNFDGEAEHVWCVSAEPIDINNGRRGFSVNQAGNVYTSKPNIIMASHTIAGDMAQTRVFGVSLNGQPASTLYLPYRR